MCVLYARTDACVNVQGLLQGVASYTNILRLLARVAYITSSLASSRRAHVAAFEESILSDNCAVLQYVICVRSHICTFFHYGTFVR